MGGFKFQSNKDDVIKDTEENIERALIAIGIQAEGYAVGRAPHDTGRLIGSITYATSTQHSKGRRPAEAEDYAALGVPEEGGLYVGTNVEYAPYQELGTSKMAAHPFLQPAMKNHIGEYEQIFKQYLGESKYKS